MTSTAKVRGAIHTSKQPINTYKQPINTSKQHINTSKQPINTYAGVLQSFVRFIVEQDWLGGWLLPQRKSYFAIRLPHDWWVFGIDNGLSIDMDADQFRYLARTKRETSPRIPRIPVLLLIPPISSL